MGVVARCGNTGVTVGSEWCGLCRVHGCEGYKSYKQKRKNKKQGREEQMVLNEFVEELDIAIKQDGHDIYCNAETASMIKAIISDSNLLHRLIKYIEDSKVYYSDGNLCSIGESIIGERVCDDILKYIDKIKGKQNDI